MVDLGVDCRGVEAPVPEGLGYRLQRSASAEHLGGGGVTELVG
jgi:hypothetical protein